jgi:hypothetical protein
MRWWMLAALCGCDGYRPIDEIDKVECNGLNEIEVFGSVEMRGETFDFDDAFFPPTDYVFGTVLIQQGTAQLFVDAGGIATVTHAPDSISATSARLVNDCPNGGRFEAHFESGDLSGWWIGGYSGW